MKNILLVEDDPQIANLLNLHFHTDVYRLTACKNGKEAIEAIMADAFDLVILDIMLPDLNGMEVCKKIREKEFTCPIMMLSSCAEESDKVLSLELGADDYVTKPFGILELLARTKALLRRGKQNIETALKDKTEVEHKGVFIDKHKRRALFNGQRLELTPKEFDLLFLLVSNPGKTFSRAELLQLIWGFAFAGYEHTITSHINRLRMKIEADLVHPMYILTSWGTGYRFSE
jgi:DNA-binding response OmpR family regulator